MKVLVLQSKGFIQFPCRGIPETLKLFPQFPYLTLSTKEMMSEKRAISTVVSYKKYSLTGFFRRYVAKLLGNRRDGSVRLNKQTKHELICVNEASKH